MSDLQEVWAEIAADPAQHGTVVRRVLPGSRHDIHLGQHRPSRQRFTEIRLLGTTVGPVPHHVPRTHGLEIKVVLEAPDRAVVNLTETTGLPTDQYEELIADTLGVLAAAPGDGAAARLVERLVAWQQFFARSGSSLTSDAAAGLFAELSVLTQVVAPIIGGPDAVLCWTGADLGLQDFQFPRGSLEVKSYRGGGTGKLHISSERQLDITGSGNLALAYVELDQRTDGAGQTLADVVGTTRELVASSTDATMQLNNKLLQAQWRDGVGDARPERYAVRCIDLLHVREGFPRLTPNCLPVGIGDVRYRIDRSAVEEFVIDSATLADLLEQKNG